MVVRPKTYRSTTMSQMTSTARPIMSAAATPAAREASRTPLMNVSKPGRPRLLHRERFVDQLLPVGDVLGEARVGALLRHVEPGVVVGVGECHDLLLVVLEGLDRLLVHRVGLALVVGLCLLARVQERLLLLLVQAVEALLGHEHRLVHEPE